MHGLAAITFVSMIIAFNSGCGSSAPVRFYTLNATTAPGPSSSNLSISVGPVSVPAVVDRPQIVVSTGPNQVWLDEFNQWASPLQDNIARVIVDNLIAIAGTGRVTLFPQAAGGSADYRAEIQLQRFDSLLGEAATLDAVWTVRRAKDGKAEPGRTSVRETVQAKGYDALAAAHSRALARLSQDIAGAVRALESSTK